MRESGDYYRLLHSNACPSSGGPQAMLNIAGNISIFLIPGATDMRKCSEEQMCS